MGTEKFHSSAWAPRSAKVGEKEVRRGPSEVRKASIKKRAKIVAPVER